MRLPLLKHLSGASITKPVTSARPRVRIPVWTQIWPGASTTKPAAPSLFMVIVFLGTFLLGGCTIFQGLSGNRLAELQQVNPPGNEIQEMSDFLEEDTVTDEGLFNVHRQDESYFFEIPDSLLGREMLVVSRVARTVTGLGYGGENLRNQVFRWERRNDQILLRSVSYTNTASDSLPVYEAVQNSNFEPIVNSFDIEAQDEEAGTVTVEVTDLFVTDIPAFGLPGAMRSDLQVRSLDEDRSFIESVNSYRSNIEARHIVTYDAASPPSHSSTNSMSLEINHSMLMLPEVPMQARLQDDRVGFFSVSRTDYGLEQQQAKELNYITRWRLEPKDPEAYLRGELVEPVKPIIFYIDPATPDQWKQWMIEGVNDWQPAFEEAGFRNAIMGMEAPSPLDNPDFSAEDARYSMIRYFASPVRNAYGPQINDPRSGEIVTSSIGWYHNVLSLLRDWFFVQTTATNPSARGVNFEDEVMGELVRFVAAHEVGHTLGLAHNFGSSHAWPVDSLRSPTFTSRHGTAPSIMDYARFNYIAQPEDGVTSFYPKIGEYDKWAIKWGYTWFGDMPMEEQRRILHEWTVERADDPSYFYGRQTGSLIDPRSQNEDLGDNAMQAGELGLANLEIITENLIDWIYEEGEDYTALEELYNEIVSQWGRYMGHVVANVGGVYENYRTFDQEGAVYVPVPRELQREAVAFLETHAFASPTWIFNDEILSRINQADFVEFFRARQVSVLENLIDPSRIARLIDYERRASNAYTPLEFMDEVRSAIWSELEEGVEIDVHRRYLQRAYVERLESMMTEPSGTDGSTSVTVSQSDIRPIVRNQLEGLLTEIDAGEFSDRITQAHLVDIEKRIEEILDPGE